MHRPRLAVISLHSNLDPPPFTAQGWRGPEPEVALFS